jgi:vacuolar-type H+-ATPase subunit E/Vma4
MENRQSDITGGIPYGQQSPQARPRDFSSAGTGNDRPGMRQQAREKAGDASARVKENAQRMREETMKRSRQAVDRAKQYSQDALRDQQHRVADSIHGYGSAFHEAAQAFRDENDQNIACYVEAAAEQLDRAADYIGNRSMRDLVDDAHELAQRQPALVVGGAFVAGLAVSRFLKAGRSRPYSSAPSVNRDYQFDDYDAGTSYSAADYESSSPGGFGSQGMQPGPTLSPAPFQEQPQQLPDTGPGNVSREGL